VPRVELYQAVVTTHSRHPAIRETEGLAEILNPLRSRRKRREGFSVQVEMQNGLPARRLHNSSFNSFRP